MDRDTDRLPQCHMIFGAWRRCVALREHLKQFLWSLRQIFCRSWNRFSWSLKCLTWQTVCGRWHQEGLSRIRCVSVPESWDYFWRLSRFQTKKWSWVRFLLMFSFPSAENLLRKMFLSTGIYGWMTLRYRVRKRVLRDSQKCREEKQFARNGRSPGSWGNDIRTQLGIKGSVIEDVGRDSSSHAWQRRTWKETLLQILMLWSFDVQFYLNLYIAFTFIEGVSDIHHDKLEREVFDLDMKILTDDPHFGYNVKHEEEKCH